MGEGLKEQCDRLRGELLGIEKQVRDIALGNPGEPGMQAWEAVRRIEDARMRLGKVLQHSDGGVSIYDKAAP